MPRVLMLSWEYPPLIEGGLARHVHKLAAHLGRAGVELHVLTRGVGGGGPALCPSGVHVHRLQEASRPADLEEFLAWVRQLNTDMIAAGQELAEEVGRFDLVHGHDWLVAVAGDRLATQAGVPLVTTIHATEYGRHQGWVGRHPQSYIHGIERWMARRADHVIACSHYMRGHVSDIFDLDESRVSVIPNGIDPEGLQPQGDLAALRAQFAAPHEPLVLLVGRLVYEKGFHTALDALARLQRRVGGVRFLVAGSGTAEAELKAQARALGLARRGAFVGWLGDDTLHSLYRVADLCVVPSIYEPFGLVALEAMASGCPCLAADVGGLREVVPNPAGLRFAARDSSSLADTMERVLGDGELRAAMTARAGEWVLRFDWADIAGQTAALYGELMRPAAPSAPRAGA